MSPGTPCGRGTVAAASVLVISRICCTDLPMRGSSSFEVTSLLLALSQMVFTEGYLSVAHRVISKLCNSPLRSQMGLEMESENEVSIADVHLESHLVPQRISFLLLVCTD